MKRSKALTMLIAILMILASGVQSTLAYLTDAGGSVKNIFIPDPNAQLSDIIIKKTVEHPFGAGYQIPDNITFDFKVEFGEYYADSVIKTTEGELTADETGSVTVTLSPDKGIGIEGLDEGMTVKVTELETDLKGFSIKDGNAVRQVTVDAEGGASAEFVNVYTPAPAPVDLALDGEKILSGREWSEGDSFTFKLEQLVGKSWVSLGEKTVEYSADNADFNKFDFNDIISAVSFDKAGDYEFRVTEIAGDLEGMVYDGTVNKFTVAVTDADMDGSLEIQNVIGQQNVSVVYSAEKKLFDAHVVFTNTYDVDSPDKPVPPPSEEPEDIEVRINVSKTVINKGDKILSPENFSFVLENSDSGNAVFAVSDKEGLASFKLIFTPDDIGKTYEYKLSEVNGRAEGVTYSDAVYNIRISVYLGEDNELAAEITSDGKTVESAFSFENIYESTSYEPPKPGDASSVLFYVIMACLSLSGVVLLFVSRKQTA